MSLAVRPAKAPVPANEQSSLHPAVTAYAVISLGQKTILIQEVVAPVMTVDFLTRDVLRNARPADIGNLSSAKQIW